MGFYNINITKLKPHNQDKLFFVQYQLPAPAKDHVQES